VHGHGFQIIQSFVAFANGGLFGTGLGESKQKLFFLPEAHTDFIVSVITEETGLLGLLTLMSGFVTFSITGYLISMLQIKPFRQFLGFGLNSLLTLQVLLNMGVAMGLLPTKGMALPFISTGSSSLIVSLICVGLLAKLAYSIDDREKISSFRQLPVDNPSRAVTVSL
jgi:cell division protein FtsW